MTRISMLFSVLWASCLSVAVSGDDHGDWFYMVKTKPTTMEREAEYNRWYDEIDIPDVLEVPSFRRARRAVGVEVPGFPEVKLESDEGKYVALYDIETPDIDKSIVDLYVAARKMNALGRSTDDLTVVEANYYQRVNASVLKGVETAGDTKFYYLQKVICCQQPEDYEKYLDWYGETYVPALNNVSGLARVDLYLLYRIMEELAVGPEEIPHQLLVYEINASSAREAVSELHRAVDSLSSRGGLSSLHSVGGAILYQQMSDVYSD